MVRTPDGNGLIVAAKRSVAEGDRLTRLAAVPPFEIEWEAASDRQLSCAPLPHPSGATLVTIERRLHELTQFVTRDAADGRERERVEAAWPIPTEVVVSPDGETCAGVEWRTVSVFRLRTPFAPTAVLTNETRHDFNALAFHPSGKYLGAASNDGTVKLYDAHTWKVAKSFAWDIGKPTALAFSADGTLAAACTEKGKVVVWDVDV